MKIGWIQGLKQTCFYTCVTNPETTNLTNTKVNDIEEEIQMKLLHML